MLRLTLGFSALALVTQAQVWNYTLNGADWDLLLKPDGVTPYYKNCNRTTKIQSPINITRDGVQDWYSYPEGARPFAFLPNFKKATPTQADVENYAYTLQGDFGYAYIKEPKNDSDRILPWDAQKITFHYPCEHQIMAQSCDLEMQIFMNDRTGYSQSCFSGRINIALRFKLDPQDNPFFDWIKAAPTPENMNVDLSMLIDKNFAMNSFINGYIGSDTFPPCTASVCWVVPEQLFTISQTQLDFFKVEGVDSNNRLVNFGKMADLVILQAIGVNYQEPAQEQQQIPQQETASEQQAGINSEQSSQDITQQAEVSNGERTVKKLKAPFKKIVKEEI